MYSACSDAQVLGEFGFVVFAWLSGNYINVTLVAHGLCLGCTWVPSGSS